VYELIRENLYGEQKLYPKYIWLRDYFIQQLIEASLEAGNTTKMEKIAKIKFEQWIKKFSRL
jgi:hypothetical protein